MSFKKSLRNNLFFLGICLILVGLIFLRQSIKSVKIVDSPSPVPVLEFTTAKVTKVFDGDTIQVEDGLKVRYIGIDTTEVYPQIQCFSQEAKAENEKLVLGREVKLVKDVSETDKYGRLLRYVYIEGGPSTSSGQISLFVNDFLVKSGFAKVMSVPPDVKYQEKFLESEKFAKGNNLGLWSKCATK